MGGSHAALWPRTWVSSGRSSLSQEPRVRESRCRPGGGHADAFATLLALHLRPETVRRDLISNPSQSPVEWDDPNLDFARHSASGVIGNPTTASAALGAALWEA